MFLPCVNQSHCRTSFPRASGDVPPSNLGMWVWVAFSPRERGCSVRDVPPCGVQGVFPARAGMFPTWPQQKPRPQRFPRASGDVPSSARAYFKSARFSPRGRGCSRRQRLRVDRRAVFPARAGMFRRIHDAFHSHIRFPRASGDVPISRRDFSPFGWFSPRERGCSRRGHKNRGWLVVFPARAGMFPMAHRNGTPTYRFPRASGDVPGKGRRAMARSRFSPRERGCSHVHGEPSQFVLVFPARAGMFRECSYSR